MWHGNLKKIELNGMKCIEEKMADTCPCGGCDGWMTRIHSEECGSKDTCETCGFEGFRLHMSDYHELLFLLDADEGEDE